MSRLYTPEVLAEDNETGDIMATCLISISSYEGKPEVRNGAAEREDRLACSENRS